MKDNNIDEVKIGDEIIYVGRVLAKEPDGQLAISLPTRSPMIEHFLADIKSADICVVNPKPIEDPSTEKGTLVVAPFRKDHKGLWRVEGKNGEFITILAVDETLSRISLGFGANVERSQIFLAYPFGR